MIDKRVALGLAASALLVGLAGLSVARPPATPDGAIVVPERFLRSWDPVTIFFPGAVAPSVGPEDEPERFVRMEPEHPGAFTWLDDRTLQFRPSEPWPALARVDVRPTSGARASLVTLLDPPTRTLPNDRADNLQPLEAITLTFAAPVPPEALARMTRIELRPSPGLDAANARWLDREDFVVKSMERKSPSDPATYVLQLSEPIRESTRALVHFALSLDDDHESSAFVFSFRTLDAFRLLSFGCANARLPVTPDGARYTKEQAVECSGGARRVQLELSSPPAAIDGVLLNDFVRFTPPVDDIELERSGRTLWISGRFEVEKRYELVVHPSPLQDTSGRKLDLGGTSSMSFFFPRLSRYLSMDAATGTVERFGPQTIPLSGRGFDRVDLRIHRIDPLDRRWWPFPARAVAVNESQRPPGPGEEVELDVTPRFVPSLSNVRELLRTLGAAEVSTIVETPLGRDGRAASFGLDLEPHLDGAVGEDRPGTYLVGVRKLDGSPERTWMRLQVTDLALSVAEEPHEVRFFVTSLKTGRPVANARVRVEGPRSKKWVAFVDQRTDAAGAVRWKAPGRIANARIRRIVVESDDDRLVVDPAKPPERFADSRWRRDGRADFLYWAIEGNHERRGDQAKTLCHVFTERPVYRPDEKVHVKGYVRTRHEGVLRAPSGHRFDLEIRAPGGTKFEQRLELTDSGSFYYAFDEKDLPTGVYEVVVRTPQIPSLCRVSFEKEAYRVPKFEVRVFGDDVAPLDRPFVVKSTASYYAGGPVAGRPVRWRVTQFPYDWSPPKKREGFRYSTDSRFSSSGPFTSTPNLGRTDTTDESGAAALELNPALEPTSQPRTYVVEATVTGADEQTVSATKQVRALPPFVLGVKVPRFLERAEDIRPQIVALDPSGEAVVGQPLTVRLVHRTWHSHLQASDFLDGAAKYITDVVDTPVLEKKITSAAEPVTVTLPIATGGVYVVEVEGSDRLGRAQLVSVDLYAGGDEAVSWKKPEDDTFEVSTDKDAYAPGETAKFLLKSPFQSARALVVVEGPDENTYRWIDVKKGAATFTHRVAKDEVPRLPVHFVLMRGRTGRPTEELAAADRRKPWTLASTKWIAVEPVEHRLKVALDHPATARPGEKVKLKIRLSDHRGRPKSGEVTLWLVDQAVLALGREQALDPLRAFITPTQSYLTLADTRNEVFGRRPLDENPGGDAPEERSAMDAEGLLDKVTVRKNFQSVPVYRPRLVVPTSGELIVDVPLPDNLTNFKIRAKAISGVDRFGFAKSTIAVRLPVIVQPNLPRFVRSKDRLRAGAIARVVEGAGGAGAAEIGIRGAKLEGPTKRTLTLERNRPTKVDVELDVGTPSGSGGTLDVTLAVVRNEDGAKDAFAVKLPIRADRAQEHSRVLATLGPNEKIAIPGVGGPTRPGTARRTILVSDEPALVDMAASLDALLLYPHGNTEAHISRARAFLASERFAKVLHRTSQTAQTRSAVERAFVALEKSRDPRGLVAQWPGSRGYVWLTADAAELMVEARRNGYVVNDTLWSSTLTTLERALRSDYGAFVDGEAWSERVAALTALARAQRFSAPYAAELANKASSLNLERIADVTSAFLVAGEQNEATIDRLTQRMMDGTIVRLHQGAPIYGGLQDRHGASSSLILPSETRTLSKMIRALDRADPKNARLPLLVDALTTLGRGDGWGTTNANAAALLALSERLEPGKATSKHTVTGKNAKLTIDEDAPVAFLETNDVGALVLTHRGTTPVVVRVETTFVDAAAGSAVEAASQGFVTTRRHLLVRAGAPTVKRPIAEANQTLELALGDVVEEHVQVVNPEGRHYVAVRVPLAAGMEPLNPALATAPAEARPAGRDTVEASYVAFLDDAVTYYFDTLAKGTYDFYFRTRASTVGAFTQPSASTEMMYDATVFGRSPGAKVVVKEKGDQ